MGKREIRPLATSKPFNRSSPKVAYVITFWISTDMQNLVTIPQGVSFPRMREIAHRLLFWFFQHPTAKAPENDFHTQYVKWRGSTQDRAISGFWRKKNKNLIFKSSYSRKPPFMGPIVTGSRKFSAENRCTMGDVRCKLPLIVIVDP